MCMCRIPSKGKCTFVLLLLRPDVAAAAEVSSSTIFAHHKAIVRATSDTLEITIRVYPHQAVKL